jgi:ketosteroid isomerase-like protein
MLEMRQANLIRELFAIIDEGTDWDSLGKVFSPGAVYFRPGYEPIRGLTAIREFYDRTRQVSSGAHSIYRILSDGQASCCWGLFRGSTKDGTKVALYFADWYRFSSELITYRRTFFYQPMI